MMLSLLYMAGGSVSVKGQEADYKWLAGASLGLAGYYGDYNRGGFFTKPGFTATLTAGYIYDSRWEFNANLSFLNAGADIESDRDIFPSATPVHIKAQSGELNFNAEFNFFPYGIGETYKSLRTWTPFLSAGVGMAVVKPQSVSAAFTPEIPLSVGVKFKITPRVNLRAALTATKIFGHTIEANGDIFGAQRQWYKNTTWITSFSVGMTYEFGERCITCHYVE